MQGIYEIYLKRNVIRKFLKIYKNIEKVDIGDLNLNTISNIRRKLTLGYSVMNKHHHKSVIMKFDIYEYRYFIKIRDLYLQQHYEEKNVTDSKVQDEFNQFISKGSNND